MALEIIRKHPEATLMHDELVKVRDCVKGAFFVKRKKTVYLPHPSDLDTTSKSAYMRYDKYMLGAEYDDIPAQTLSAVIGKMDFKSAEVVAPTELEYLLTDADGDGMRLTSVMEKTAENALAVKWHVLVADYQGLSDVAIQEISIAELKQLNPRASIKQYNRDSVIYWHHERVNGKMQLVYIMLFEQGVRFDSSRLVDTRIESYLILALDENGEYYQQKIVRHADNGLIEGERSYVKVNQQPLKWLPVKIVSDVPLQAGSLPMEMGYLSGIINLTLSKYYWSAELADYGNRMKPSINIFGVSAQDWTEFQEINGRDYIEVGGSNVFGKDVNASILSPTDASGFYFKKQEELDSKLRALGAVFPSDMSGQRTATEVESYSEEQASRLIGLAGQLEEAFTAMLLYCGMFQGLWTQEAIEDNDQVSVKLKKEFGSVKMTAQEVQQVRENYLSGLIDKREAIEQLSMGGWTVAKAQELLDRADGGDL